MDNQINITLFNDGGNPYRELLETFLKLPIGGTDEVFELFSSLPGAIYCEGPNPMERFVYVPGTRKDRVLLTAHADTVWDERYGVKPVEQEDPKLVFGIYCSPSTDYGVGADDRVGCAMLWGLCNSGHSILVTDGEERGKIGARYLRECHKKLFREINRTHSMILSLDAPGSECYRMDDLDNSGKFRDYLEAKLEIKEGFMKDSSDLDILCGSVCGVNLGVGFVNPHRNTALFFVSGWNIMYRRLYSFLEEEHPRFPISTKAKLGRRLKKRFPRVAGILGKIKRVWFKGAAAACLRRIKRKPGPKVNE